MNLRDREIMVMAWEEMNEGEVTVNINTVLTYEVLKR